ncbi:MAG: serine/threonine protein kinase, partial [Myxococcales bacterium]|nr:serine/threonine protein kinase [Myxococcales bacterium]
MASDHEITHVTTRPEAPASLIDDVRLDEQVGGGLSSSVYRGTNLIAGRPCAVKLLRPELGLGPVRRGRYIHEAEGVATLGHSGVADVFRFGVAADGRSYALCEWVDGSSLRSLIRHNAPLSRRAFLPLIRQLAAILGGIHAAGFAHRRLHGGNIMVSGQGNDVRIKLLDFGIWRAHPPIEGDVEATRSAEHAIAIAPEIGKGEDGDARSDVYALGVLLYEMLTGKVPFLGQTFAETVAQHVNEDPMPPSQVVAMPQELEAAIMRALEKDPKKRTPSVEALLSSLGALSAGTSAQHAVVPRPPQARSGRVRDLTSGEVPTSGDAVSGGFVGPRGDSTASSFDDAQPRLGEPLVTPPGSLPSARSPLVEPAPAIEPALLRPPKRKLWLFVALGVAILAFGGALAYILIDSDPAPKRR